MNAIDVEIVSFSESKELLRRIRFEVFVEEQGVPAELEMDENDAGSIHALARIDGKAVGVGRLLPDGHIGRVAVLREFRGKGIGLAIMKCLLEKARDLGMKRALLSSQVQAVAFYERLGFVSNGDVYLEAGIEHVDMAMTL